MEFITFSIINYDDTLKEFPKLYINGKLINRMYKNKYVETDELSYINDLQIEMLYSLLFDKIETLIILDFVNIDFDFENVNLSNIKKICVLSSFPLELLQKFTNVEKIFVVRLKYNFIEIVPSDEEYKSVSNLIAIKNIEDIPTQFYDFIEIDNVNKFEDTCNQLNSIEYIETDLYEEDL